MSRYRTFALVVGLGLVLAGLAGPFLESTAHLLSEVFFNGDDPPSTLA
jgi:hypothetical protein